VSKQAERDKTIKLHWMSHKIEKKKFYYNDSGQVLPSMARMGVLKLAL
jgi:hypothetical protein